MWTFNIDELKLFYNFTKKVKSSAVCTKQLCLQKDNHYNNITVG